MVHVCPKPAIHRQGGWWIRWGVGLCTGTDFRRVTLRVERVWLRQAFRLLPQGQLRTGLNILEPVRVSLVRHARLNKHLSTTSGAVAGVAAVVMDVQHGASDETAAGWARRMLVVNEVGEWGGWVGCGSNVHSGTSRY